MADPVPTQKEQLSQSDKEKLAAFEAAASREKRIQADMAWRRDISRGGIPDNMLREIAEAQIAHDDREAAKTK